MPGNGLFKRQCFESEDYIQCENLNLEMMALVHCFLLGGVDLEKLDIKCCIGGGCVVAARTGTL